MDAAAIQRTKELANEIIAACNAATLAERERCAKIAEVQADSSGEASNPYDGGSGSLGYESACRDIAANIRRD